MTSTMFRYPKTMVLLFCALFGFVGCSSREQQSLYGKPFCGGSRHNTVSTNYLYKTLNCELPMSVTNAYIYEEVGGMQSLLRFARFDVEQCDLESSVSTIMSNNCRMLSRPMTYIRKPITSVTKNILPEWSNSVSWWDVTTTISNGYSIEEGGSYSVHLWVDTEKSRIYLHQTD
jgi:hypothetical protein